MVELAVRALRFGRRRNALLVQLHIVRANPDCDLKSMQQLIALVSLPWKVLICINFRLRGSQRVLDWRTGPTVATCDAIVASSVDNCFQLLIVARTLDVANVHLCCLCVYLA